MKPILFAVTALVLCMRGVCAADALAFDNGPGWNETGGAAFAMTSSLQAEDFSFSAQQTITGVRFWALEHRQGYAGEILWSIRADAGGKPSASSIASNFTSPSRTATGFLNDDYRAAPQFIFEFDIPQLTLDAGHYWLTLHNGPLSFDVDDNGLRFLLWDGSVHSPQPGNPGLEDEKPFDEAWGTPFAFGERAFQLVGVPEPGALLMTLAITVLSTRRAFVMSFKIRDAIATS